MSPRPFSRRTFSPRPLSPRRRDDRRNRERALDDRLDRELAGVGAVLHRRSVSGDGGVIDHLVIAPTGIWIIDVSGENGRVERRDVGGFMRQDIRLFVDQHDRTDRTEAMSWQTDAIQRIIEPLDVVAAPLHRVLCFTDADWARFARPFDVVEVLVCWPASLISMIGDSGPFDSDTIDIVALQLDRELPPA